MSDVGEVAGAVRAGLDLLKPLIEEHFIQKYENEFEEDIKSIQNAFADNNADDLYAIAYKLLVYSGNPPTPSRDAGVYNREFIHSFLIATAQLVRERKYLAAYFNSLNKK